MPKYQVTDQNTGKKYVITAPDQASALSAFQQFSGNAGGGQQGALAPKSGPDLRGLPIPGTTPTQGYYNQVPPNRRFGFSGSDTLNPLPAIAAFGDEMAAKTPIAGPWLQQKRDELNANIHGGTPQDARTDINETVRQNPIPATAGGVVGSTLPYAAAASNPLTAGALGMSGPILQRLGMTLGSQYAINTGDNLAHGQSIDEAAKNAIVPAIATTPFAIFGRGAKPSGSRSEAIEMLKREGVPLTGGQARGSKALMQAESQLGGSAAQTFRDRQLGAYTKAALKSAGINADNAGPEVMQAAFDKAGSTFETLAKMSTIKVDRQLQDDLLKAVSSYEDASGQSIPVLTNILNRVGTLSQQNGGTLKGESYQMLVTDIREAIEAGGPTKALGKMREALDDAVERSVSGQTKTAWQTARQRYANLMTITNAVKGAGQFAAQGLITPEALRSAVAQGNPRRYVKGGGDLNSLARNGVIAMPQLPDSGTASRMAGYMVAGGGAPAAALTHALTGGDLKASLGVAAASAASSLLPYAAGRALLSGPGRSLLTNGTTVPATVARGVTPLLMGPQN
jgi:hypothetical protein